MEIDTEENENSLVICEFNPQHKVSKGRITHHYLNKCRDYVFLIFIMKKQIALSKGQVFKCFYDGSHIFASKEKYKLHKETCAMRVFLKLI